MCWVRRSDEWSDGLRSKWVWHHKWAWHKFSHPLHWEAPLLCFLAIVCIPVVTAILLSHLSHKLHFDLTKLSTILIVSQEKSVLYTCLRRMYSSVYFWVILVYKYRDINKFKAFIIDTPSCFSVLRYNSSLWDTGEIISVHWNTTIPR